MRKRNDTIIELSRVISELREKNGRLFDDNRFLSKRIEELDKEVQMLRGDLKELSNLYYGTKKN
jgi:FtsZ-binding cell division protein ZapB